ncbi:MAG: hypothetical protein LBE08_06995 [Bifidobacteriaceae bacterium]|jgi:hypothetical protein|nr:hypothetical protein [Bifidobacteriaceae bacterium]
MPRDIAIITPAPLVFEHWQAAAAAASEASGGPHSLLVWPPSWQFTAVCEADVTTISTPDLGTVLTAAASQLAREPSELRRLIPETADFQGAQTWWTEAWAPWGPGGAAGVSMARALAASLGGIAQAAEGG